MLLDVTPTVSRIARAARHLGLSGGGWVLGYHPVARMNPYQALLYSRADEFGFAPVGLVGRSDLESLEIAMTMGTNALLHLHWTSGVLEAAVDRAHAEDLASEFLGQVASLRDVGVRVLWSVHNVLPHRCLYPEVESRLRAELAESVDVIHVMAPETIEATSSHYPIPETKVINAPHPSYLGAYPSYVDRSVSRFELGYEPFHVVFGVIGSIQPYKGLREFANGIEFQMRVDPHIRALVGGLPGKDQESKKLVKDLVRTNHIELVARKLTDLEIAEATVALDAAVLPYHASLNSGAALLALSFGVPIVAPLTGGFKDLIGRGLGVGYVVEDPNGLRDALGSVRSFLDDFDPRTAVDYASTVSGPIVSERFFGQLRAKLTGD